MYRPFQFCAKIKYTFSHLRDNESIAERRNEVKVLRYMYRSLEFQHFILLIYSCTYKRVRYPFRAVSQATSAVTVSIYQLRPIASVYACYWKIFLLSHVQ